MKIDPTKLENCKQIPKEPALTVALPASIAKRWKDYCLAHEYVQSRVLHMIIEDFLDSAEKDTDS